MGWLFNLLYLAAGVVWAPFGLWRILVRRKPIVGWRQKFTGRVPMELGAAPRIWLHAVSVGEVNLLVHLLPRLEQLWPECQYVVSTTTKTGHEMASRNFGADRTIFFPFDFTWSVTRALEEIRPELIILAELEIWPNLMRAARRRKIPVAVINGRLSSESFRKYCRLRWLVQWTFKSLSWVGAQNQEYAQRFVALGVEPSQVSVTGNMKFDGAKHDRANSRTSEFRAMLGDANSHTVWLAGSTHDPEERIAVDCFQSLRREFPDLRLIVAPRHPDRCQMVVDQIRSQGLVPVRRSSLHKAHVMHGDEILVVDSVGELTAWWGLCHIAYVGGSMNDRGGQNMIEPAAYGCAVSFGPNTKNFRDVVSLLTENQASVVVRDSSELEVFVRRCLSDESWREQIGSRARQIVLAQAGATQKTIDAMRQLRAGQRQIAKKAA